IADLERDPLVRMHAPLLAEVADHFASAQVRNAATLGGNVCNASPAGDTLPALLALDAEAELARLGPTGAGTRPALDISPVAIAFAARRDARGALQGVRLALGAVGPTPLRARRAEALLEGQVLAGPLAA